MLRLNGSCLSALWSLEHVLLVLWQEYPSHDSLSIKAVSHFLIFPPSLNLRILFPIHVFVWCKVRWVLISLIYKVLRSISSREQTITVKYLSIALWKYNSALLEYQTPTINQVIRITITHLLHISAADCGCYCNDKPSQLSLVILSILTHSSCVSGIHIQYYPNLLLMPIANTTYKPLSHY